MSSLEDKTGTARIYWKLISVTMLVEQSSFVKHIINPSFSRSSFTYTFMGLNAFSILSILTPLWDIHLNNAIWSNLPD